MDNEKEITKATEAAEQTERANVIALKTPYKFEGTEYQEIDLSGLEKLTVQDAIDAQRQLMNEGETAASVLCETTTAFARIIAAKTTGLPIEFFKLAPRGVSKSVTRTVREYVMPADDGQDNHVMRLEKPYHFKGKEYRDIDLNGIANLNSMHESEAENWVARAGFVIVETSLNTLHACCLASMATGLPEEFFTGLPINEALKLRNAVNDAGFFE